MHHLLSEDEVGRGKFGLFVDEVDRGLVNESWLPFCCEDLPFLLVETDVGVEPSTE